MSDRDPFDEPETAHPRACELMAEAFFWDCADEEAPFGSDEGHGAYHEFREWRRRNEKKPLTDCLAWIMQGEDLESYGDELCSHEAVALALEKPAEAFLADAYDMFTLDATVIATEAIQRGPDGTYVFVVGKDDKVQMRPVKVSRQDEKIAVIAEGVTPGEKVVTSGFGRLKDGAIVSVSDGTTPAAAPEKRHRKSPDGKASSATDKATDSAQTSTEAALVTGSTTGDRNHQGKHHHQQRDNGASP